MSATSAPDLLPNCPWCDYALEGLPVEHRCPECGAFFDRRWRVFGGKSRWSSLGPFRKAGTLLFVILLPTPFWYACHDSFGPPSLAAFTFNAAICLLVARGLFRSFFSTPSEFVAIGTEGVTIGNRETLTAERYDWASIKTPSETQLQLDGRPALLDAWRGNVREAAHCVNHIRDLGARWGKVHPDDGCEVH